MKKVAVFTGSRSEYGLIKNLIHIIFKSNYFNLGLIVSGTHLAKNYGKTLDEIKRDKIQISKLIKFKYQKNMSDPKYISSNMSKLMADLVSYLKKKNQMF